MACSSVKTAAVCLLVVCFWTSAKAKPSCPECNQVECPVYDECPFGTTEDICGCCEICAQGPGDECGGYMNHGGICARGLACKPNTVFYQLPGQCVPVMA